MTRIKSMVSYIFKTIAYVVIVLVFNCCHSSRSASGNQKAGEPFTFFVLGDWGFKGQAHQLPVAKEMIKQSKLTEPSLILTVGDNFYDNGVESLQDEHWTLSYENVYKELTQKYPWYVTVGNHDYRGNLQAQIDYHSVNRNWNMPALYYTFVKDLPGKQKVRFIIIDTDPYIGSYYSDTLYKKKVTAQDTAKQTRWIESVLANSKEKWKIVLGHHPLYSAGAKKPDTTTIVRVMQPLFEKYKVQAYICGHDHIGQYNRPKESKVAYIISGGGGKPNTNIPKVDYTLFSSNEPSFSVYSIQNDQLTFKFIDTSGVTIYQNTIPQLQVQ